MADPIPFYAAPIPTGGEMPPGAIPVRVYGLDSSGGGGVPPIESDDLLILAAYEGQAEWDSMSGPGQYLLFDMDYGLPGQVLAMNSDGDGLKWGGAGLMALLAGMGPGGPNKVLAMNSAGDGLKWVDMPTAPTEPS